MLGVQFMFALSAGFVVAAFLFKADIRLALAGGFSMMAAMLWLTTFIKILVMM